MVCTRRVLCSQSRAGPKSRHAEVPQDYIRTRRLTNDLPGSRSPFCCLIVYANQFSVDFIGNGHFSLGESGRRSGNACRSLQITGVGKNIRRVCQPDAGGRFKNCLWHIGRRLRICDSFPRARANINWEKRADFLLLIGGVSFRLPPCGRRSAQKPLDFHSRDFSSWTAGRHHFSADHLQAFVLRSKRCDSVPC
jgi:hypothetical protein